MYNKLGALELESYGKKISLLTDYDSFCGFFDDADVFRYNEKDVTSTSYQKVIINEAYPCVRVPLNGYGFVKLCWFNNNPIPNTIRVFHNKVPDHKKPLYACNDFHADIKEGRLNIPLICANCLYKGAVNNIEFSATTNYLDLCQISSSHNIDIQTTCFKEITLSDFLFDGVDCLVKCYFNRDDRLRSISLFPSYSGSSEDSMTNVVERALICKDKLISLLGDPTIDTASQYNEFSVVYEFDNLKVCASLSHTPRDNYPEWSGISVVFQ